MERAIDIFSAHNGILRTRQAMNLGISPRSLYAMRDAGVIRQISRGVYQLASLDLPANPDLIRVAIRIPRAVICLISALHYYGLTTQIPHKVYIALPQSAERPRLDFPPLDIIWLSDKSYSEGVTETRIDGTIIKMFTMEKTIADCFKFRNKVGVDVALDVLKEYVKSPERNFDLLLKYARIDRVEKIITNYLEALL
jgi:predicted transcriptional regulator of viral defense system